MGVNVRGESINFSRKAFLLKRKKIFPLSVYSTDDEEF